MSHGRKLDPRPLSGDISVTTLVDEYFLAYNAARLREAAQVFTAKMLEDDVTVCLTLSGALTPTGLGHGALVPLVDAGFVDWIISTGANLYHDLHYALNFTLRRGSPFVDDRVGAVNELFLVQAAADARLVGDDDDGKAGVVQQADGVDRVREEDQALETIEVSRFFEHGAITVQENGPSTRRRLAQGRLWFTRAESHSPRSGATATRVVRRRVTAANTVSTLMPRMQRWSMGQSLNMQGRQNTW
jgi:hypothetical protein